MPSFNFDPAAPCAAQHFGIWSVEPQWMSDAIFAVNSGVMKPLSQEELDARRSEPFAVAPGGIAVVSIHDQITKGGSSFGGTSSLFARKAIRLAESDESINGIMLHIDSPGGTAAGTQELAEAVAQTTKPIRAHIDDLGASAAFWVASQADTVTVNEAGEVGSIGTLLVVSDSSKAAEDAGVKVHVISTGEFKGMGAPGTEVTEDMLAILQERVDDINKLFLKAVSFGRELSGEDLSAVSDGRVFISHKALTLGLVDGVSSFGDALNDFASTVKETESAARARARVARARLT